MACEPLCTGPSLQATGGQLADRGVWACGLVRTGPHAPSSGGVRPMHMGETFGAGRLGQKAKVLPPEQRPGLASTRRRAARAALCLARGYAWARVWPPVRGCACVLCLGVCVACAWVRVRAMWPEHGVHGVWSVHGAGASSQHRESSNWGPFRGHITSFASSRAILVPPRALSESYLL